MKVVPRTIIQRCLLFLDRADYWLIAIVQRMSPRMADVVSRVTCSQTMDIFE